MKRVKCRRCGFQTSPFTLQTSVPPPSRMPLGHRSAAPGEVFGKANQQLNHLPPSEEGLDAPATIFLRMPFAEAPGSEQIGKADESGSTDQNPQIYCLDFSI